MKIHIYHHSVNDCEEQKQLDRIEKKVDAILLELTNNDEPLRQQIMDKLNALIEDVKQTIS